jgi:copper chaperone
MLLCVATKGITMISSTYTVDGMTCGHCVGAVTRELGTLEGVAGVTVQLATGRVVVESAEHLDEDAVRAAIDEAGYVLRRPDQLPLVSR